jgi:CopG family nickel-responsive transcriptional regulator
MPKIVRVGVTFPPNLLKEFDDISGKLGYKSRSKAVQDAVEMFVAEKKDLQGDRGAWAGVLMFLYEHDVGGLENELTQLQHSYIHIVRSTLHVHLTEEECLEVIVVTGSGEGIRELSNRLSSKRGVKILKTALIPTQESTIL